MSDSSSFHLLDERIQRFIWAEGWESLRDAQEAAIPLIVKADRDVIVAAATAAGKTEAAQALDVLREIDASPWFVREFPEGADARTLCEADITDYEAWS